VTTGEGCEAAVVPAPPPVVVVLLVLMPVLVLVALVCWPCWWCSSSSSSSAGSSSGSGSSGGGSSSSSSSSATHPSPTTRARQPSNHQPSTINHPGPIPDRVLLCFDDAEVAKWPTLKEERVAFEKANPNKKYS
jgi:hypothetical protein